MKRLDPSWQALSAIALMAVSIFLPAMTTIALDAVANPTASYQVPFEVTESVIRIVLTLAALLSMLRLSAGVEAVILLVGSSTAAWLLIDGIAGAEGTALAPFFLLLAASWLLAWRAAACLSKLGPESGAARALLRLLVPALFGVWILVLWEALVRGLGVPFILLPPPSAIGVRLASSLPVLWADVVQTIFRAALTGYVLGCGLGFALAVLADRFGFLRRGLMPIGNLMSALPIIGVAPILVNLLGFDWHSKAAVVVLMTTFPMLVNTVAGLAAAGHMERDLLRTYASGYWQTLWKLRLPAAMPFIFNALKINSTLALIGAIVAEFFGTPVVGMGFRISTEVGRMNIDMVWAEIAVAAMIGSLFYGLIALVERAVTFWHPSVRGGRA